MSERPRRPKVTFKQVVGGIALILALVFVLQNSDKVQMHFIFFSVTARLWVGLIVSIVLGILIGLSISALRGRRGDEKED